MEETGLENYFQKAELEPSQGTFSPHRGGHLCDIGPGDGRIAVVSACSIAVISHSSPFLRVFIAVILLLS